MENKSSSKLLLCCSLQQLFPPGVLCIFLHSFHPHSSLFISLPGSAAGGRIKTVLAKSVDTFKDEFSSVSSSQYTERTNEGRSLLMRWFSHIRSKMCESLSPKTFMLHRSILTPWLLGSFRSRSTTSQPRKERRNVTTKERSAPSNNQLDVSQITFQFHDIILSCCHPS